MKNVQGFYIFLVTNSNSVIVCDRVHLTNLRGYIHSHLEAFEPVKVQVSSLECQCFVLGRPGLVNMIFLFGPTAVNWSVNSPLGLQ